MSAIVKSIMNSRFQLSVRNSLCFLVSIIVQIKNNSDLNNGGFNSKNNIKLNSSNRIVYVYCAKFIFLCVCKPNNIYIRITYKGE